MSDASCCPRSAGALPRKPSRAPERCWAPERGVPEGLPMAPLPGLRALHRTLPVSHLPSGCTTGLVLERACAKSACKQRPAATLICLGKPDQLEVSSPAPNVSHMLRGVPAGGR